MRRSLLRVETSRPVSAALARDQGVESVDDLWPGLAGLIVLGVVVAVFALGYFVWVFYQLVILGAT